VELVGAADDDDLDVLIGEELRNAGGPGGTDVTCN
jgi:hypothetical protein